MAGDALAEALENAARRGLDFSAVLTTVTTHFPVESTQAIAHCHHVALDGSSLPRLQDFANEVANWLLDYVVPRRKLMEATSTDPTQTRLKNERLRRTALEAFKQSGMSGEQGEMLLFVLAEAFLGLPQLLCKMDLKTDGEMHFHGVDGVHCGVGNSDDQLAIYWCESKVFENLDNALSDAFDSLKPFLLGPGTGGKDKRRELVLLDRYMDIGDADLQAKILKSIDPDSPEFNTVSWRGLCLIGFDHEYPSLPNSVAHAEFTQQIADAFPGWCKKVVTRLQKRNLETFEIHLFYIPLGFCEDFRTAMKKAMGLL